MLDDRHVEGFEHLGVFSLLLIVLKDALGTEFCSFGAFDFFDAVGDRLIDGLLP